MWPKLIDMNERSNQVKSVLICLAIFAVLSAVAFGFGFSTGYACSKTSYAEMKALAVGFQTEAVKSERQLETQVKDSQRLKADRDELIMENQRLRKHVDEVLVSLEAVTEDNVSLTSQLTGAQ